jgi:hypothetical protein
MIDETNRIYRLLRENSITFKQEEFTSSPKSILITIGNTEPLLYVLVNRVDGDYLASDLSSTYLPRELYSDTPNAVSPKTRSEEIIQNAISLVLKKITFTTTPSIFSKHRGYIRLPIDGKITKIKQRKNYFNLPAKLN